MGQTTNATTVRQRVIELLLSNRRHRRLLGFFVVAALLTSLTVAGLLRKVGVALTREEAVLSCPVPSGEHVHTDICFDEEGNLICGLEEHVHGPGCYSTVSATEESQGAESPGPAEQESPNSVPEGESGLSKELESRADAGEDLLPGQSLSDEVSFEDGVPLENVQDDAPEGTSPTSSSSRTDTQDAHQLTLTYETNALAVTASIADSEPIPEGARLEVTPITPGLPAYDAYMAALNRDFESEVYTSANSLLYDISVMVGDEEFEPSDGKVDVKLDFKHNQLSEELGINVQDESAIQVIHLPVTELSAPAPSDPTAAPDPNDIAVEYVPEAAIDATATDEVVSFSLNSLSVITVTTANTDVNISASLLGTDMQSLGYNLYAYLLASNDNNAYGAKISFANGNASATIPNVPANTYRLYLVYARDNRELQERWNYGNVLDANTNNWVDADGGYIFGYSARMPEDKTVTPEDNSISFALEIPDAQSSISLRSIMDRAINYGIVAEDIKYNVRSYTNFAAKHIDISNSNDSTIYSSRADGVDVVPNILASIDHNGQPMSTQDKPANYYVIEEDKDKVSSNNLEDTIIRNQHEISDRVEIMLNNTLRQCDMLAASSMATLPPTTSVDVSGYADNATIILKADAISGEMNGFTIVKRPGQTVVFNINGQNAAPPQNVKVKLVDKTGQQVDIDGNPSTKTYVAGDEMRDAEAKEGKVWSSIVWNFPDATSVTATNQCGGIYLVPKGDFTAANKGGGWIVARGKVTVTNEWYGFPGSDEPFKQKIIRKTFVGIGEDEIDPNYLLHLYTHVNDSTSGTTTNEPITMLVLKPADDPSLIHDPTGVNDQTGYLSKGTDENGNVVIEWRTPPLSVGNEHALTEEYSTSVGDPALPVELVEFVGPFSEWSDETQDYEWVSRESQYASEADFEGIFNVSTHNEDYRLYVYVTNNYRVDKSPHDLTLRKAVVDPEGIEPADQSYTFQIALADANGVALAGTVAYKVNDGEEQTDTLSEGVLTLQLKRDDVVKVLQLPYGTQYTILETGMPAKCAVAFSGDTSTTTEATGKLIRDRSVTATNTFSDDPGVPVTAHKDLVDGTLHAGQFAFRLIDGNGRLVREAVNDENGNISFGTLVFDVDGDYDYRLFEVADSSQLDIIYDPTEYIVHLHVEGGRVRQVSYTGVDGHTYTTPMFVNRQIPAETDTLTARKVFIDNVTGKAVKLEGGEFTFTATSNVTGDMEPIVYTGTNDADGMVTFYDSEGNVVDLDELTQPETFVIAEDSGSYRGAVPAGRVLKYDTSTHEATAEVKHEPISRNPWTTEVVTADTTSLTLTFTPSDTSGTTYYIGGNFGVQYSEIRSDGTVSFTININKNNLNCDNAYHNYAIEYGVGDNYHWEGGHRKLDDLTITAKAGDWGQDPVEVSSVSIGGQPLNPTTEVVKTVTLTYADGHYPVFVNTLDADEPQTTDFPFTKVWVDNVTYANPQAWGIGKTISVNLSGEFVADGETTASGTSTYAFNITCVADEQGQPTFEFVQPQGEDAPQIEVSSVSGGTNHYAFVITGLPDRDTVGGAEGCWSYHLTEEPFSGYAISYGSWDSDEQRAVPNPVIAEQGIAVDGYVINAAVMVELPSAGGLGTAVFTMVGSLMIAAGLLLALRRVAAR